MKEAELKFTRLNNWIWRNLPDCKAIVKLMTASMDGRLTVREWIVMKVHLFSCDSCVNFLKQIRFIRETLLKSDDKLVQEDQSVKLSDDARARMKRAIESSNSG